MRLDMGDMRKALKAHAWMEDVSSQEAHERLQQLEGEHAQSTPCDFAKFDAKTNVAFTDTVEMNASNIQRCSAENLDIVACHEPP